MVIHNDAAKQTRVGSEHWHCLWGRQRQLPLPSTEGLVPVHPISLRSLRNWGQAQFKYSFLHLPFEGPFKDKIMTELHTPKWTIPRKRGGCS